MRIKSLRSSPEGCNQGRIRVLKEELRGNTPDCKTHPDAPHGFDRNASHIVRIGMYVSVKDGSRQSVNGLG
jgi:hypothetical protein